MRLSVFKGYFFFTCIVVSVAVEIVALAEDSANLLSTRVEKDTYHVRE